MEVEQIYEKAWYAVTETCLAMTIFRDEFDVRFIIMFGVLLFVKCFSWIGSGRVEFVCYRISQECDGLTRGVLTA
jgi:E3 ubiquitin-protein ligase synoviolin